MCTFKLYPHSCSSLLYSSILPIFVYFSQTLNKTHKSLDDNELDYSHRLVINILYLTLYSFHFAVCRKNSFSFCASFFAFIGGSWWKGVWPQVARIMGNLLLFLHLECELITCSNRSRIIISNRYDFWWPNALRHSPNLTKYRSHSLNNLIQPTLLIRINEGLFFPLDLITKKKLFLSSLHSNFESNDTKVHN